MNPSLLRRKIANALLAGAACAGAAHGVAPTDAQYVRSRDIVLELHTETPATQIDAWLSRDNTATWSPILLTRSGECTYCYAADEDGTHDFYFVLTNDAGASAEPPASGAPAHATVHVDTLAPIVQFRDVAVVGEAQQPFIYGRIVLIEDDTQSLRLFCRTAAKNWNDVGAISLTEGRFAQPLPALNEPAADFCVVATDRAGNVARDERLGVEIPPAVMPTADELLADTKQTNPLAPAPQEGAAPPAGDTPSAKDNAGAGHVEYASVEPGRADQPTSRPVSSDEGIAELQKLRAAAVEFAHSGQHSLAAARLADALQLAPDDNGLLVDLGREEYELGQYDEAAQRFESVLHNTADHVDALDGLALVAATQRRYPVARDALRRRLELEPRAARAWLNYGDVEYRLGHLAPAKEAWQKAATFGAADPAIRSGAQRRMQMLTIAPTEHNRN